MDGGAVEVGAAMNAVGCCACQLGAGFLSGHCLACCELMGCFHEGGGRAAVRVGCGPQATMVELSERWGFWLVQTAGGGGGGGGRAAPYSGCLLQASRASFWRKMLIPSIEGSGREVIPTRWSWENPNREM